MRLADNPEAVLQGGGLWPHIRPCTRLCCAEQPEPARTQPTLLQRVLVRALLYLCRTVQLSVWHSALSVVAVAVKLTATAQACHCSFIAWVLMCLVQQLLSSTPYTDIARF